MKNFYKIIVYILFFYSPFANAGFDWGSGCNGSQGGSGTFSQYIQNYGGNYENAVTVGTIPAGLKDVYISLKSSNDVDIRLYHSNGTPIVHWPNGILKSAAGQSVSYNGVGIEYSGYNGDGTSTGLGNEYIKITGTTTNDFVMKAFGYVAGAATVDYSWKGKIADNQSCSTPAKSGVGTFSQYIQNYGSNFENAVTVGTIPAGLKDVYISLKSPNDVDIRLYHSDGTPIVHWPNGILKSPYGQSVQYKGVGIEYSGYNGDGTSAGLGNEYIKIIGTTANDFIMKAFGYSAGNATVDYYWGDNIAFPFFRGVGSTEWQICQGYNTPTVSHTGTLINSFDFAFGSNNIGATACNGNKDGSSGKEVLAPADGKIYDLYVNDKELSCLTLDKSVSNGHGKTIKSLAIGHMHPTNKRAGKDVNVKRGAVIGELVYGTSSYTAYAHIHLSSYEASNCTGTSIPFGTLFGGSYDFTSDGSLYQWHGKTIPKQ